MKNLDQETGAPNFNNRFVQNLKSVSFVIPALNESGRIIPTIKHIAGYAKQTSLLCEIIVIDDGSTDNTLTVLKELKNHIPEIKIISLGNNHGKGAAIKIGIKNASKDWILLTDADESASIEFLNNLAEFSNEESLIIGSRYPWGKNIITYQPWLRKKIGSWGRKIIRTFFISDIHDTQCGFKLIKTILGKKIAPLLTIKGFAFDVELLTIAAQMKESIKEVTIEWKDSKQSTVRVCKDSYQFFCDLLHIRSNLKKGLYKRNF